jgi:hypothetical protein
MIAIASRVFSVFLLLVLLGNPVVAGFNCAPPPNCLGAGAGCDCGANLLSTPASACLQDCQVQAVNSPSPVERLERLSLSWFAPEQTGFFERTASPPVPPPRRG